MFSDSVNAAFVFLTRHGAISPQQAKGGKAAHDIVVATNYFFTFKCILMQQQQKKKKTSKQGKRRLEGHWFFNLKWQLTFWPAVDVIKLFFGGNLEFPQIKKWKKVCYDVWTCTKMWKQCCFKQIYTLKLFIGFKMAYSCCFPEFFHQKSFITSTTEQIFNFANESWPLAF